MLRCPSNRKAQLADAPLPAAKNATAAAKVPRPIIATTDACRGPLPLPRGVRRYSSRAEWSCMLCSSVL